MELIDYFQSYCKLAGEPLSVQRKGKYILVINHGTSLLILGIPKLHPYHADIMASYCDREDIGHYRDKSNGQSIAVDSKVRVKGGGRYDIDDAKGTLQLYDYSTAYGPVDRSLLTELEVDGYELKIW